MMELFIEWQILLGCNRIPARKVSVNLFITRPSVTMKEKSAIRELHRQQVSGIPATHRIDPFVSGLWFLVDNRGVDAICWHPIYNDTVLIDVCRLPGILRQMLGVTVVSGGHLLVLLVRHGFRRIMPVHVMYHTLPAHQQARIYRGDLACY